MTHMPNGHVIRMAGLLFVGRRKKMPKFWWKWDNGRWLVLAFECEKAACGSIPTNLSRSQVTYRYAFHHFHLSFVAFFYPNDNSSYSVWVLYRSIFDWIISIKIVCDVCSLWLAQRIITICVAYSVWAIRQNVIDDKFVLAAPPSIRNGFEKCLSFVVANVCVCRMCVLHTHTHICCANVCGKILGQIFIVTIIDIPLKTDSTMVLASRRILPLFSTSSISFSLLARFVKNEILQINPLLTE